MKLFASLMAVGIFAAPSAFAQTYTSPAPNCRPGDLNCPATYEAERPLATGRSATEVAPPLDTGIGRETIRSEAEVKREGATGMQGMPPLGSGNSNR